MGEWQSVLVNYSASLATLTLPSTTELLVTVRAAAITLCSKWCSLCRNCVTARPAAGHQHAGDGGTPVEPITRSNINQSAHQSKKSRHRDATSKRMKMYRRVLRLTSMAFFRLSFPLVMLVVASRALLYRRSICSVCCTTCSPIGHDRTGRCGGQAGAEKRMEGRSSTCKAARPGIIGVARAIVPLFFSSLAVLLRALARGRSRCPMMQQGLSRVI